MKIKNVEIWYEGIVKLTKSQAITLLKDYLESHQDDDDYSQTLDECVGELCNDGYFDLGDGYISISVEIDGCPEDLWEEIKEE